ncbi:MAG: AAA family ATPase [Pseudonocardiaceae bacterium]
MPAILGQVCAVEQFVAVVGPPGVGKSTVTGALAKRLGARVFRLREFAREFRRQPGADERLFNTRDPLSWFAEETVFLLLQAAFVHGQFPARGLVVLENFPGSLTQLLLLKATADQLRAPLTLIELTAADIEVMNWNGSRPGGRDSDGVFPRSAGLRWPCSCRITRGGRHLRSGHLPAVRRHRACRHRTAGQPARLAVRALGRESFMTPVPVAAPTV